MDLIKLKNNQLELDILPPGSKYKKSRFDWTGIIEQIHGGGTTFLGKESLSNNFNEGLGLQNEFGIITPIGYKKASIGKEFMKIGVGALTKNSFKPYSFANDYRVRPFETEIKSYSDRVEFNQKYCYVGSFGYNYLKTIKIQDNKIAINYSLHNIGYSVLKTEEYNHNFLRVDNMNTSIDTRVELNSLISPKKIIGPLAINKNRNIDILEDSDLLYLKSSLKEKTNGIHWKVSNNNKSVECTENFQASDFALWGKRHVISPEVFFNFKIKPGETLNWSRNYTINF